MVSNLRTTFLTSTWNNQYYCLILYLYILIFLLIFISFFLQTKRHLLYFVYSLYQISCWPSNWQTAPVSSIRARNIVWKSPIHYFDVTICLFSLLLQLYMYTPSPIPLKHCSVFSSHFNSNQSINPAINEFWYFLSCNFSCLSLICIFILGFNPFMLKPQHACNATIRRTNLFTK